VSSVPCESGEKVEIRGFGSFHTRERPERESTDINDTAMNPTAEQMQIASMIDTKVQALSGAGGDDPQRVAGIRTTSVEKRTDSLVRHSRETSACEFAACVFAMSCAIYEGRSPPGRGPKAGLLPAPALDPGS
jgi:hypothetical protein